MNVKNFCVFVFQYQGDNSLASTSNLSNYSQEAAKVFPLSGSFHCMVGDMQAEHLDGLINVCSYSSIVAVVCLSHAAESPSPFVYLAIGYVYREA